MVSQDIPFLSAAEIAAAIKSKQVSPVEVVQSYLERIDRLDPNLRAYITVCREEALDAARQAEQAVRRGDASGSLFGVPMAVKDQFWTEGILTTNGSRAYKDFVPGDDATVIKGIKDAGAILLGKLNLSELAMGGTQSPPWGIPRNPWDLERTPGESSSGSGVALSAHLCAIISRGRYRRFGARARVLLQRGGLATHIHSGEPLRRYANVLVHGCCRSHDQNGGRLRPGPWSHRRL